MKRSEMPFVDHDQPRRSSILARNICSCSQVGSSIIGMVVIATFLIQAGVAQATPARLLLRLTDSVAQPGYPIGRCFLSKPGTPADAAAPAYVSLTLTEDDVESYARDTGRWLLSAPKYIAGSAARQQLADRCFVLTIDAAVVASGVMLHGESPRMVGGPTLFTYERGGRIVLQLVSSSHGMGMRLLLLPELGQVFAEKPVLQSGTP